jgi:hypothetical protein
VFVNWITAAFVAPYREARRRHRARDRRDVDDQSVGLAEQGQRSARYEHEAAKIDVQLQVDVFRLELVDRPRDADPGGVHEDVEPFVAPAMLVDDSAAVALVGDVRLDRQCVELARGGHDLFARSCGQGQPEALAAQHSCDRESDTRGAAGDERSLGHEPSLQVGRCSRDRGELGSGGTVKAPPLP